MASALSNRQFFYDQLFQQLTNLLIELDSRGDVITFNPAAEKFYRLPAAEVLGNNFIDLLKINSYECPAVLTNVICHQQLVEQEFSHCVIFPSGDKHQANFKIISLTQLQEQSSGFLLIGTDLTQAKNAEKRERNSQKYIKSIIDSIAGNHWWKDVQGRYIGGNNTLTQILGLDSPADIIGKTDYDMPWADTANELVKNDHDVMKGGVPQTREEQVRTKDGKLLSFLVTKVPLRDEEGNVIGTVGTSTDITKQVNAQIELQIAKDIAENANRAKSEFIANISHDLRTPLAGILGIAEILEGRVAQCEKEIVHDITRASQILFRLLNEIIEYTKIESGIFPIQEEAFNLESVVDDVVSLMLPSIKQKQLKLTVNYDAIIPVNLYGDRSRIQRIILNLISNAVKFTHAGGIIISVVQMENREDSSIITLIIEDSGIGIPEHEATNIFNRFTRLTASSQGLFKGVGLGLNIVKRFVTEMKGEINLESVVDKGSKFYVTIPLAHTSEPIKKADVEKQDLYLFDTTVQEQTTDQNYPNNQKGKTAEHLNILLVEDDPLAQKVATFNLVELGCLVTIASNGNQAVSLFMENDFDLILIDIGLPDMDGYQVAETIRRREGGATTQVPLIALSAHSDAQDIEHKQRCLHAKMNGVLQKPLNYEKAKKLLEQYF
jgi:two-component system aerobic respiration control sensor histidine kinase ArcB